MRVFVGVFLGCVLVGCSSSPKTPEEQYEDIEVAPSFLKQKKGQASDDLVTVEIKDESETESQTTELRRLPAFSDGYKLAEQNRLKNKFSDNDSVSVAADKMPIEEFLHYSMGTQLSLNYVLASDLPLNGAPITLNISDDMSSRQFFSLIQDVLQQRGMSITERNNVFYVVKTATSAKGNVAIGVGSLLQDVPNTSTQVLQIIPTRFGISTTLERTLVKMIDASVVADFQQNVLFVQGRRAEIIRAIELVQLLDQPLNRGKNVAIIELTYVNSDDFINQVRQLLTNEGVSVGMGIGTGQNIVFVPLSQIGSVAVFASDLSLIQRVQYWGSELDKPATNSDAQYFMYTPKFARASDLGESISRLLGQTSGVTQSASPIQANSQNNIQQPVTTGRNTSAASSSSISRKASNLSLVVDERSNSLIFYGAGSEYQSILPLVKKLDVLPKQIVLEISVVEVTLTGQFQKGVEFALNQVSGNNAENPLSTLGALGVTDFGGLTYLYEGVDFDLTAKLFRDNALANVLSNPTIVVRDGVTASFSVGSDIPVVTSQTVGNLDDLRNTTQLSYRQAGLQLDVKPTVNAQNIVLMEIDQYLSNTQDFDALNPAFFERTLSTEVVAKSGQTILLGGIISENSSKNENAVPGLADIPILGHLFKGNNSSSDKTELVILVTARVLDNTDEWDDILQQFQGGLDGIKLNN